MFGCKFRAYFGHSQGNRRALLIGALFGIGVSQGIGAQVAAQQPPPNMELSSEEELKRPANVKVNPTTRDQDIEKRLINILTATHWFIEPTVDVKDGVVFLSGRTQREELKRWAGDLAHNTQDVAAVVNHIEVTQPVWWDLRPALGSLKTWWQNSIAALPSLVLSALVLLLAWLGGRFAFRATRLWLRPRRLSPLLEAVIARSANLLVMLIGFYLVLQVAGLTSVAMTVIGGTGLLGLILGIAFRDITENFLASVFLTVQRPFRPGDLIEVSGVTGLVQQLTARATTLMALEGNHVQIPNSIVYKSVLHNYTSNPNRRIDFGVGIGYDDSVSFAQSTALDVLRSHPAVLRDPESWVLVETLDKATVNLRVYFWLDGSKHSWLKVRSSVIRLIKHEFQKQGIAMPDEAREIIFPQGVPIQMPQEQSDVGAAMSPHSRNSTLSQHAQRAEVSAAATTAEGGLSSEAADVQEQAHQSRRPEEGPNLLVEPPAAPKA